MMKQFSSSVPRWAFLCLVLLICSIVYAGDYKATAYCSIGNGKGSATAQAQYMKGLSWKQGDAKSCGETSTITGDKFLSKEVSYRYGAIYTATPLSGSIFKGWYSTSTSIGEPVNKSSRWDIKSGTSETATTKEYVYYACFDLVTVTQNSDLTAILSVEDNPIGVSSTMEAAFSTDANSMADLSVYFVYEVDGQYCKQNEGYDGSLGTFVIESQSLNNSVVTIRYHYKANGVAGTPAVKGKLVVENVDNPNATNTQASVALIANVNLKPSFELSFAEGETKVLDFGTLATNAENVTASERPNMQGKLALRNLNAIADKYADWTATIGGTNADQFEFVSGSEQGVRTLSGKEAVQNCDVRFRPTKDGNFTAKLTITATSQYKDKYGNPLRYSEDVTLQGCGATSVLHIMEDGKTSPVNYYSFEEVIGLMSSKTTVFNLTKYNVGELSYYWVDDNNNPLNAEDAVYHLDKSDINAANGGKISVYAKAKEVVSVATPYHANLVIAGVNTTADESLPELERTTIAKITFYVTFLPRLKPSITWNWATLYENNKTTTPAITTSGTGVWSIVSQDENIAKITKEGDQYVATTPYFYHATKQVSFTVHQDADEQYDLFNGDFTSQVVKKLNSVSFTVNSQDVYDAVKHTATGVSYTGNVVQFKASGTATFIMAFEGKPEVLTFTSNSGSGSQWTISTSADGNAWSTLQAASALSDGEHTYSNVPQTAQYIRFEVTNTASAAATATNITVTEYKRIEVQEQNINLLAYGDNLENVQPVTASFSVSKATQLTATLDNTTDFAFAVGDARLSTVTFTEADGLGADKTANLSLRVVYIGEPGKSVGKNATVLLQDNSTPQNEVAIYIGVVEAPYVAFEPSEYGTYIATYSNEIKYEVTTALRKHYLVDGALTSVTLSDPKPATGYTFFVWCQLDEQGNETYISRDVPLQSYATAKPMRIQPKFISDGDALFVVKGDNSTQYDNLNTAVRAALNDSKVVVVSHSGAIRTPGTYTIPSGVTLLVPRDDAYTVDVEPAEFSDKQKKNDNNGQELTTKEFRRLTLSEGVILNVGGAICVNARQRSSSNPSTGHPVGDYGIIDMQGNSQIILSSGANLYAYGFITGQKPALIKAERGSFVYEDFQFSDWRGGTYTMNMTHDEYKKYKVFPFNQYYVQNIEAPLQLQNGAVEKVFAAVSVGGTKLGIDVYYSKTVPVDFIGTGTSLFRIQGDNLTKWYDPATDRQIYEVNGDAEISSIRVNIDAIIMKVNINSKDYVLPVNNNMSIFVHSGTTTVASDAVLLPDAVLQVDNGASVYVGNGTSLYVYDADHKTIDVNGKSTGYFCSSNGQLYPVKFSPTKKFSRSAAKYADAKIDVNGTLAVSGSLYTTGTREETEVGASICSSEGTGIVDFRTIAGSAESTFQTYQSGETPAYYPINITQAKLQHGDGSYLQSDGNTKYTYYPNMGTNGEWSASLPTVTGSMGDTKTVYLPSDEPEQTSAFSIANAGDKVLDAFSGVLTGDEGFVFAGTDGKFENSRSFDSETQQLLVRVKYAPAKRIHGTHTATLTLTNTINHEVQPYPATLSVAEDYTVGFSVANMSYTFPATGTGLETATPEGTFLITPADNNVAGLTATQWSATVTPRGTNTAAGEFSVSGDAKNSIVSFHPVTGGSKEAVLSVTATYTDDVGEPQTHTETIVLHGEASALQSNSLHFSAATAYVNDAPLRLLSFDEEGHNTQPITLTITPDNWQEIVELSGENENVTLTPKAAGTIQIKAEQPADAARGIAATTITQTFTVLRRSVTPTWNWGRVYGNQTYTDPVSDMGAEPWTVVKKADSDTRHLIDYDVDARQMTVRSLDNGAALQQVVFVFSREQTAEYEAVEQLPYTTLVYPDPRLLPIVMNEKSVEEFRIIALQPTEATFDASQRTVTIPAGKEVILQFTGIPGMLTFTSEGVPAVAISADGDQWTDVAASQAGEYNLRDYDYAAAIRISNTTASAIVLSDVRISASDAYSLNTYYGMAKVVSSNPQYGEVGGAEDGLGTAEQPVFSNEYVWARSADKSSSIRFSLYARPVQGCYFTEWTTEGEALTQDHFSPDGASQDYKLIREVSLQGYPRGLEPNLYSSIYCRAPEHNCEDEEAKHQGILEMMPFVYAGTWQANFALAEVVKPIQETVDFGTIPAADATDAIADVTQAVAFSVKGDGLEDFVPALSADVPFTIDALAAMHLDSKGILTVNTVFTPQDIHGAYHSADLTLSRAAVSGVAETSSQVVHLTAYEDWTPRFELTSPEDFASDNLGVVSTVEIAPSATSSVAKMNDISKLHWTARVLTAQGAQQTSTQFSVTCNEATGNCVVRYSRTAQGEQTGYLEVTATYTDSKGTKVPYVAGCTLKGTCNGQKSDNPLTFRQEQFEMYVDETLSFADLFSGYNSNNPSAVEFTLPANATIRIDNRNIVAVLGEDGLYHEGTYQITSKQAENNLFNASQECQATIVVKKYDTQVKWNWSKLYFGTTNYNPVTTTNQDGEWTLQMQQDVIDNVVTYDENQHIAKVGTPSDNMARKLLFTFRQAEGKTHKAVENVVKEALVSYDPRRVTVSVTTSDIFKAVTIPDFTSSVVQYADATSSVHFSPQGESCQWTLHFLGVPNELKFNASGNGLWQIEESADGNTWTPAYAWAAIDNYALFVQSLKPATGYLRIAYQSAAGNTDGVLSNIVITALDGINTDVKSIFIPQTKGATKQINIVYASLTQPMSISSASAQFTVSPTELEPTTEEHPYRSQVVTVTNTADTEQQSEIMITDNGNAEARLSLPIATYVFPQSLPIRLHDDEVNRFYFVTTDVVNAIWLENSKTIKLLNTTPNTTRSVTFAFADVPSRMSFNHTATSDAGVWKIEESATGTAEDWSTNYEGSELTGMVQQNLNSNTRYVRIAFSSPNSEPIYISDLVIMGEAVATANPTTLTFTEDDKDKSLVVHVANLETMKIASDNEAFSISHGSSTHEQEFTLTGSDYDVLGKNKTGDITFSVHWNAAKAIDKGVITISDATENRILATVQLSAALSAVRPGKSGIFTGEAQGVQMQNRKDYTFEEYKRREVDLTHAFAGEQALFDSLYIFGETSTYDNSSVITAPTSQWGSNAVTPCYVYGRENGAYKLVRVISNANASTKIVPTAIELASGEHLSVYMTGFCPYISTGFTKNDEGAWFFRGAAGATVDIYLEDCQMYSRSKTENGHTFASREDGEAFNEAYVLGSGGVLVFECNDIVTGKAFCVNIHTRATNVLKSHYGCFYQSPVNRRAFQISSPIQVHMHDNKDALGTVTELTFDDKWSSPTDANVVERTNGFLSLRKQVNNAPSIDLGNTHTVVNFRGGQVELQNASIVSTNYKTTLAISYRSGKMGGFQMAYGLGTDEAKGGVVNFYDGTTTVIPMEVSSDYRQYYLMDTDNPSVTSCLRCPQETYIYGGSHCFMRACQDVTSKGGAPTDGTNGKPLGQFKYPLVTEGTNPDKIDDATKLVEVNNFPNQKLQEYYATNANYEKVNGSRTYGLQSVTATDGNLWFWIPEGYDYEVKPEVDKIISYWKACMTQITAGYSGFAERSVGGPTDVKSNEQITNFLYCKIDDYIRTAITDDSYNAPVQNPATGEYTSVHPKVENKLQDYVLATEDYQIEEKLYYIAPAVADIWMTFAAPFDVDNIYVIETYDEEKLSKDGNGNEKSRDVILQEQARNNADFASFFGVVIALGYDKPFDAIYSEYIQWAKEEDKKTGLYQGGDYTLRGMQKLEHFQGYNWLEANYYLLHNTADWDLTRGTTNDGTVYSPQWERPIPEEGKPLLTQGEVYSMLFPYCTGCDVVLDGDGNKEVQPRKYWDYWSGKFLIFEGHGPQTLHGSKYLNEQVLSLAAGSGVDAKTAILTGNSTFAECILPKGDTRQVFTYSGLMSEEGFMKSTNEDNTSIEPTTAFLVAQVPNNQAGMPARRINMQTGEIIYDKSNVTTDNGKHTPTVSGGADMFITTTEDGIRIAVRDPQHVRVYSSDGALVFDGHIDTSVDVALHTAGIYVVRGEQEVQKIMVH